MFEFTLEFIWDLFDSLTTLIIPFFEFMNKSFGIGDFTFTIFEMIFGGGLFTVFAIRVYSWIVGLIIPD